MMQTMRRCLSATSRAAPSVEFDRATSMITISPKIPEDHTATVIFMHGLGDTADGWAGQMLEFYHRMPHTKFVLPTAPTVPVSLNFGMRMPAWYDIKGLSSRDNEECTGLDASRKTVQNLVDSEISAGIPSKRIIVGGFSQGGALAAFTALQPQSEAVGGVLMMSSYLPRPQIFSPTDDSRKTPILMCHGTADPMVRIEWAEASRDVIVAAGGCGGGKEAKDGAKQPGFTSSGPITGTGFEWRTYPGLEHGANDKELRDVLEWLVKRIPGTVKSEL